MDASLKFLKRDKKFAALIKKHGRPELNRGNNLFQALVRSIVYQQLSGKAAATIYRRFTELFKANPPAGGFPKPEEILQVPFEKLRSVGLSGQKASYILDLAEKFSDGTIKHKKISKMSTEEVTKHLTQIKGVGVWTVHMLQIFTLGRLDVLPTGDLGVQKGFQIHYKLKKLPTPKDMERLAAPWREHASVVSWYMWRLADEAKLSKIKKLPKREKKKAGRG